MKIGKIAQEVDVSESIIRHYEEQGLLPRASRDTHGYREYNQADLERVQLVVGARELRISVADIKDILAIHDKAEIPSPRILELLQQKASTVDQRGRRLNLVQSELRRLRELAIKLQELEGLRRGSRMHQVVE